MTKGPLVYLALILAAALMIVSAVLMLNRDLFVDNSDMIMIVTGILALAVVVVLIVMLFRMRGLKQ